MRSYALTFSKMQLRPSPDDVSLVYQAVPTINYGAETIRLRRLTVTGTVDPTDDVNVGVFVLRRLPTAGGSFAVAVSGADVAKADPGAIDFPGAGYREALSKPEMLPQNTLWVGCFYIRGKIDKRWSRRGGDLFTRSRPLEILAVPRSDVDVDLTGSIEIEQI